MSEHQGILILYPYLGTIIILIKTYYKHFYYILFVINRQESGRLYIA